MADLRERWKSERVQAAAYDFGVQTYPVAWVGGRALWGYDINRLWESVERLAETPDDAAVLDLPCGGGLAFRALRGRRLRYVAADLSTVMLGRARNRATESRLDQVRFVQADIVELPFPDGAFDLCISYNGLHCLPDPHAGVAELARVLRPGGLLRGTTVFRGAGRRHDLCFAALRRFGAFGPGGTLADLRAWLADAGLQDVRLEPCGAVAAFTARKARP